MGTPNSSTHDVPVADFYPYDLFMSTDPDEGRQAQKTGEIVFGITQELRPILKYISVPLPVLQGGLCCDGCTYDGRHGNVGDPYYSRIRGVKLLDARAHWQNRKEILFLQENGNFFISVLCSDESKPEHYHDLVKADRDGDLPMWSCTKFGALIEALKRVLTEATDKREQYLAAINQRTVVLDQLLAVLKRES